MAQLQLQAFRRDDQLSVRSVHKVEGDMAALALPAGHPNPPSRELEQLLLPSAAASSDSLRRGDVLSGGNRHGTHESESDMAVLSPVKSAAASSSILAPCQALPVEDDERRRSLEFAATS